VKNRQNSFRFLHTSALAFFESCSSHVRVIFGSSSETLRKKARFPEALPNMFRRKVLNMRRKAFLPPPDIRFQNILLQYSILNIQCSIFRGRKQEARNRKKAESYQPLESLCLLNLLCG